MAKADRLERYDQERIELEADYRQALVIALKGCAAGSWGLFAHNDDRWSKQYWAPTIEELRTLAHDINKLRGRLGIELFQLHEEFEAARGPVSPQAPGEPKQALAWLARLNTQE